MHFQICLFILELNGVQSEERRGKREERGEKREERGAKISTEFVKDNNEIF